jgi:hypothetical protein
MLIVMLLALLYPKVFMLTVWNVTCIVNCTMWLYNSLWNTQQLFGRLKVYERLQYIPIRQHASLYIQPEPLSRNESGRFGALNSDSTHHFFRNACTKSGSLRFSQFSGCWLILSVYILISFDFPFVRLLGVR